MAGAQTLAHPGWRGNGIAPEAWWRHGAFVRFPADTTFAQVTASLNRMSEAGADSAILPDLQTGPVDAATSAALPFQSRFGTEDDLDTLLREASARRMHVLVQAGVLRLSASADELRFWMSRGIAGFDLGDVRPADQDSLGLLQGATERFSGKRVLLARMPDEAGAARRSAAMHDTTLLHLEGMSHPGVTPDPRAVALEIHSAADLTSLPPHAALVVDAALLAEDDTRALLRRTLTASQPVGSERLPHGHSLHRRRRGQ